MTANQIEIVKGKGRQVFALWLCAVSANNFLCIPGTPASYIKVEGSVNSIDYRVSSTETDDSVIQ